MQGIGIGVSDFKRLRVRDNYFIDKSLYIKDIIDKVGDIQLCLVENANNLIVKTIGFKISNLAYCGHYRAFLKYIESLDGVKDTRWRDGKIQTRGFTGIKLKEDPTAMYTENVENSDNDGDMEL